MNTIRHNSNGSLEKDFVNGFNMTTGEKLPENGLGHDSTAAEKETLVLNVSFEEDVKMIPKTETEKFKFTSTFSTYMTLLGYSIGMSDFWRFPFLAYRNGGGAFLIPFIVMIMLCGFPLYFLEYSLSKFSGRGPYKIWDVSPVFRGIGVTIVSAYSLWMIGTTVLRCWIIDFLVNAFTDPLPWTQCTNGWNTRICKDIVQQTLNVGVNQSLALLPSSKVSVSDGVTTTVSVAPGVSLVSVSSSFGVLEYSTGASMTAEEEFWQYRVLELSSGISDLSPLQWRHIVTLVVIRIVIMLGLVKSIKSIEKVFYVTATVPFFLTVAIFIRSLMLPGSNLGLFHFIYPDFEKIIQPRVWIEATLMAFYTLGFGWGANMLLGSHAHFKENCLRTSIILPLANMFMATFSGLVCFSVLGNMAYSYGVEVTDVINAGIHGDMTRSFNFLWDFFLTCVKLGMSVGIVAYITALSSLPFPQIWTVCFLTAIILTGIDGQLVPMDMLMQLIGDLFPRVKRGFRIYALIVVGVIFFLCSLPTCTGAGAYIFLWMDWYNGAWIGPIVAFIQLVVVAWVYGMDRFSDDVYMMIGRPIPGILRFLTAFIAPLIVLVIFLTSCVEYVPPSYGNYTYPSVARTMGWISVAIVMSPMVAQGLYTTSKAKGSSFFKKLKQHLQPTEGWGPCEEEFQNEYNSRKAKYATRSMKDLLFYNLFGHYHTKDSVSKCNTSIHE